MKCKKLYIAIFGRESQAETHDIAAIKFGMNNLSRWLQERRYMGEVFISMYMRARNSGKNIYDICNMIQEHFKQEEKIKFCKINSLHFTMWENIRFKKLVKNNMVTDDGKITDKVTAQWLMNLCEFFDEEFDTTEKFKKLKNLRDT